MECTTESNVVSLLLIMSTFMQFSNIKSTEWYRIAKNMIGNWQLCAPDWRQYLILIGHPALSFMGSWFNSARRRLHRVTWDDLILVFLIFSPLHNFSLSRFSPFSQYLHIFLLYFLSSYNHNYSSQFSLFCLPVPQHYFMLHFFFLPYVFI